MSLTKRLPDYAKPLALLIGAYVAVCFALAYRRYAVFGSDTGDIAYFHNMFDASVRGRLFHVPAIGYSNLGVHAAFLWVQFLPFYWLAPGVPTLLFVQSLLLGLCAWPVYLIAREVLPSHRAALLLAAAFLCLPPIISQHVNQLEEPAHVAVYLLFTFYFFLKQRFWPFLGLATVTCLGRENMPLAVAMFGVYALIQRRGWRWVVAPIVLGGVYFWFAMFVVMPHFRQGHPWHVMKMFSYLGNTPGAVVWTALTQPGIVVNHLLETEVVLYVLSLLQPMGWVLPFLSPASLLALPDLAINTITDNGAMRVIPWHYNVVTSCYLFVGVVYGVARVGRWLRGRWGGQPEGVVAAGLLALAMGHWFLWLTPRQYQRLPHHATLERAIAAVPPGKSALVSIRLLSRFGLRERFNNTSVFVNHPDFAAQFEYVLLDANDRQYPPFVTPEFLARFAQNPNYRLVFNEQNVFVFQRLGGESDWKVPVP